MAFDNLSVSTTLLGGALVGLAASLLLLCNGRIAGVSGIAGGLLRRQAGDVGWRLAFLTGLLVGGGALAVCYPPAFPAEGAVDPLMIVAGLLVGFGTQLGNGCTSGHGVCGISRGSPRSIAATVTFIVAGMATVYVRRHVMGG